MSRNDPHNGFTILEILISLVVVALVVGTAYYIYNRHQDKNMAAQSAVSTDTPPAPIINSESDLSTAEETLDDTQVDSTLDDTQLDEELSNF